MTSPDSPIADFYPSDFEIDMNGKRYSWQGVAKLPFVEETRLLDAVAKVEHLLTEEEIRRNSVLYDMLFVVASHPLAELIRSLNSRTNNLSNEERAIITEKIDPGLSHGMNGYIASCGEDSQPQCFSSPVEGMEDILANQVICAIYKFPDDIRGRKITHKIPKLIMPRKSIQQVDMKRGSHLWHEDGNRKRAVLRVIKKKRSNPENSITGDALGKVAHRLVMQTINAQPANMNSGPALCPNAVFQNQLCSNKIPAFKKNRVQLISPRGQNNKLEWTDTQNNKLEWTDTEDNKLDRIDTRNILTTKRRPRVQRPQVQTPQIQTPEIQIPERKPTKAERRAQDKRMMEEARKRKARNIRMMEEAKKRKEAKKLKFENRRINKEREQQAVELRARALVPST